MTNDEIEFATINEGLKEALFSCARDEIRKLAFGILGPVPSSSAMTRPTTSATIATSQRGWKYLKKGRNSSVRRHVQSRHQRLSTAKPKGKVNRRPSTACSFGTSNSAYKSRHAKKNYKKAKCSENHILLCSNEKVETLQSKQPLLSFVSTKWIERSAKIINKSSKDICDVEGTKTGKCITKHHLGVDVVEKDTQKAQNPLEESRYSYSERRPKSAYTSKMHHCNSRISNRHLSRPTTALERRAPLRPSTAHVVRAKAEHFGQNLLRPLSVHSLKDAQNKPIPTAMGPHAWENELARHIVSVYNNKAVSDVKGPESSMRQKKESGGPKEISNLPSKLAQDFFNHAPQSSFHEPEESLPPDTEVKQFDRSSFADISSNEKILNQTKQLMKSTNPQMIWLCGTGDASHWDWDELKVLKSHNSIALKKVYFERKYIKYIMIVKSEICSLIASHLKGNARKQDQLWRKLVLSANGFASKLIEEGKYSQAIEILEIASNLLSVDYIKSEVVKQELDGLLKDTHAYYYSRRSKPSAALQYIIGAANTKKQMIVLTDKTNCNLRKIPTPIDLAKCHLHRACILQQLHRFEDAIKFMQRVLTMVDTCLGDGGYANTSARSDALQDSKMRRIVGEEDTEITLLVAVTHHNIAVIQILMGHIGDACISSQNCRRLSRLCMSISSRYVAQFEETHMKALCELSRMLSSKQTKDEALVFQKLVLELFD